MGSLYGAPGTAGPRSLAGGDNRRTVATSIPLIGSVTLAAVPCSPRWGSPGRTTLLRRTSEQPPKPEPISRPGRMGNRRTGMLLLPAVRLRLTPNAERRSPRPAQAVLAPDQSAALRDRLVAEVDGLQSADEAAGWARGSLPAKNTLTAADADLVEADFRAKRAVFGDGQPADGLQEAVQSLAGADPCYPTPKLRRPQRLPSKKRAPAVSAPRARAPACATRTTSGSCPSNRASCAAANLPMRIIFALRSRARWDAKSAMSSRFRFAAFIIASFTGMVTRRHGGRVSISIRCRLHAGFGEARTVMERLVGRPQEICRGRSRRARAGSASPTLQQGARHRERPPCPRAGWRGARRRQGHIQTRQQPA